MKTINFILRTRYENFKYFQPIKIGIRLMQTSDEEVNIPKRISRGPTDILRALESTIKVDPTSAHYKYHDDPYLMPMSNIGKRTFAMSQESGRKAAHWVRAQHPDLFQHQEAFPPIKMLFPKGVYNESDVTEEHLKSAIDEVLVKDAIDIYKLCKERGIQLSLNILVSFLEILCYYNCEDTVPEEFIEERWFRQSNKGKERLRKTWRDGDLAEEIFIGIDKPDGNVYSAIIQGMAKYYQVDRAWELFQEAHEKGLLLNINAYNSIICVANFIKEGYDLRWTFIVDILTMIDKAKIKPNLQTLNAVLEALSFLGVSKNTKDLVLQTLTEFRKIGIEPTLSSWYHVLNTFYKSRGPVSWILGDILTHVENKDYKIKDMKDTLFFVTAMDICSNQLKDKELAKRIDKLLHFGNNYNLIGDSFKESVYYRNYFSLLSKTEPLDVFMEQYYFKLVPHIYVPEPAVMDDVLNAVDLNNAVQYMPRIWSDMIIFDHVSRERLLNKVLNILMNNHREDEPKYKQEFADIAWNMYTRIDSQDLDRTQAVVFTGGMLGNILTVLLRNNDYEKADAVMDTLSSHQRKIVGVPEFNALRLYLDYCIKEQSPAKAITCIEYSAEIGFQETEDMARKLNQALTLDERHIDKLLAVVGSLFMEQSLCKTESTN